METYYYWNNLSRSTTWWIALKLQDQSSKSSNDLGPRYRPTSGLTFREYIFKAPVKIGVFVHLGACISKLPALHKDRSTRSSSSYPLFIHEHQVCYCRRLTTLASPRLHTPAFSIFSCPLIYFPLSNTQSYIRSRSQLRGMISIHMIMQAVVMSCPRRSSCPQA